MIGILLTNLGSPNEPTTKAVRKYLKDFLSDPRVVDLPRWQWLPVLHGVILNVRPKKVAQTYSKIWGDSTVSPLVQTCLDIGDKLKSLENINLAVGMCYGEPSISSAIKSLGKIDKLIILSMFPQNSSATNAAIFDAVHKHYSKIKHVPSMNFINGYYDHELYIDALANSVNQYSADNKLIISFHSLPQRYTKEGDVYQHQCEVTAKLLVEKLKLNDDQWQMGYQSRFGREPWLEPNMSEILQQLPKDGVKSINIISPGFSADCLETLEELVIADKQKFINAGGVTFNYIPALNDSDDHIKLLVELINQAK